MTGGSKQLATTDALGDRAAAHDGFLSEAGRAPDRIDLGGLWLIFRRRLRIFFYTAIIIFDIAALVAVYWPRQYTATAVVVLNGSDAPLTPSDGKTATDVPASSADVETEMAVVTSRDIAAKVVDYLHLENDADLRAQLLGSGGWRAMVGLAKPAPEGPLSAEDRAKLRAMIISWMAGNLDVERVSSAYAFSVAYTDSNAIRAAAIANATTHIYSDDQVKTKQAENERAVKLLGERIGMLQSEAQADFDAVQAYRIDHNLLSTTGATLTEQEISAYNQQVAGARAQTAADQAQLRTARSQLSSGSSGDDLGEALSSPVVQSLRAQRAQVSAKVSEYLGTLGPRHPDLLDAMRQLADIDMQIQAEIGRLMSNLEAKAKVSQQRLSSLSGSLGAAQGALSQNNKAMVDLDDLQRKAEVSQALYESYLNRYKEAVAAHGAERAASRMVSDARIPGSPSWPKVPLILALGLLLGVGAGFAAAIIAELSFDGLTSGDDVKRLLGLPYLGGVPDFKTVEARAADPLETVRTMPRSPFAESIKGVLEQLRQNDSSQVVLVTSALPDVGKTTLTACLAQAAVQAGRRVLVIDCDSARQRFSKDIAKAKPKTPGLREVLSGDVTIAAAIRADEKTGISMLPITNAFDASDPQVDAAKMDVLIKQLREHFHLILLDSAPLLAVVEPRELAPLADRVILVTRWRRTSVHAVRSACDLLPARVRGRVGLTLSLVNMKRLTWFSRGEAAAYYRSYKEYHNA